MDFIKNINKSEKTVDFQLFGEIGRDFSGDDFAAQVSLYNNFDQINIHINSVGGSIRQGHSIVAAMDIARDNGVKIKTINRGVADSMAGIILANGDLGMREALDFSSGLVHEPLVVDKSGKTTRIDEMKDSDIKSDMIKFKNSLLTVLENATSKSKEEIAIIMEADTRLDAYGLMAMGFVDYVTKSSNKPKLVNSMSAIEMMAACSDCNINKPKKTSMKLYEILNVSEEAGDEALEVAVNELKAVADAAEKSKEEVGAEVEELKKKLDAKEKELEDLKAEIANVKSEQAEAYVDAAIERGVFASSKRDELVNTATKDFDSFKSITSMVNVKRPAEITEMINKSSLQEVPKDDDLAEIYLNADKGGTLVELKGKLGDKIFNKAEKAWLNKYV